MITLPCLLAGCIGERRIGMLIRNQPGDYAESDTTDLPVAALALGLMPGGCFTQNYQRGCILAEGALEQIPLGAPQEQVLITLGTPSTVATVSGEVFYYISKRTEQTSFLPESTTDQRVVAVYFDKSRRVQRIANYGIQDGKVFDSVSRTTPTGGQELNYLSYVFKIFGAK